MTHSFNERGDAMSKQLEKFHAVAAQKSIKNFEQIEMLTKKFMAMKFAALKNNNAAKVMGNLIIQEFCEAFDNPERQAALIMNLSDEDSWLLNLNVGETISLFRKEESCSYFDPVDEMGIRFSRGFNSANHCFIMATIMNLAQNNSATVKYFMKISFPKLIDYLIVCNRKEYERGSVYGKPIARFESDLLKTRRAMESFMKYKAHSKFDEDTTIGMIIECIVRSGGRRWDCGRASLKTYTQNIIDVYIIAQRLFMGVIIHCTHGYDTENNDVWSKEARKDNAYEEKQN